MMITILGRLSWSRRYALDALVRIGEQHADRIEAL